MLMAVLLAAAMSSRRSELPDPSDPRTQGDTFSNPSETDTYPTDGPVTMALPGCGRTVHAG
jgi:hypothetical protein